MNQQPGLPRRRLGLWLGIGGGVVVAVVVVLGLVLVTGQPSPAHPSATKTPAHTPSSAKPSAGGSLASSAMGPSACVTSGQSAGGGSGFSPRSIRDHQLLKFGQQL